MKLRISDWIHLFVVITLAPVADAPVADAPVADAPVADAPVADALLPMAPVAPVAADPG